VMDCPPTFECVLCPGDNCADKACINERCDHVCPEL
jgi:hypothetical protein